MMYEIVAAAVRAIAIDLEAEVGEGMEHREAAEGTTPPRDILIGADGLRRSAAKAGIIGEDLVAETRTHQVPVVVIEGLLKPAQKVVDLPRVIKSSGSHVHALRESAVIGQYCRWTCFEPMFQKSVQTSEICEFPLSLSCESAVRYARRFHRGKGATLAQSVEQLIRNQQVVGSNPTGGSKEIKHNQRVF